MAKKKDIAAVKAAQVALSTVASAPSNTTTVVTPPPEAGTDTLRSQLKKLKDLSEDTDKSYQAMKAKQAADMKRLEEAIKKADAEAEARAQAKAEAEAKAKTKAPTPKATTAGTGTDLFKKNGPAKVYRYWDVESQQYRTVPDYWAAEQLAPGAWKAIWVMYVDGKIDHVLTREEFERYLPM